MSLPAKAWIVTLLLAIATGFGLGFAPGCNFHGRCPWYSDLGVFLIGGLLVVLSFLVALVLSLVAWWRRR